MSDVPLVCLRIGGTVIEKNALTPYLCLSLCFSYILSLYQLPPPRKLTTINASNCICLAGGVFQPVGSRWRAKDSWEQRRLWEPNILLSHRIHFPSHNVHLDVSAGKWPKFSPVELAGYGAQQELAG